MMCPSSLFAPPPRGRERIPHVGKPTGLRFLKGSRSSSGVLLGAPLPGAHLMSVYRHTSRATCERRVVGCVAGTRRRCSWTGDACFQADQDAALPGEERQCPTAIGQVRFLANG